MLLQLGKLSFRFDHPAARLPRRRLRSAKLCYQFLLCLAHRFEDSMATSSMDLSGSRVVRDCRAKFGLMRNRTIGESRWLAVQRMYSTAIPARKGIKRMRLASLQKIDNGPSAVKTRMEISTSVSRNAVPQRACSMGNFATFSGVSSARLHRR